MVYYSGHLFVGTQFNIKAPLKYEDTSIFIQDTFLGTQFNFKTPLK